jgi:hypothetical protein
MPSKARKLFLILFVFMLALPGALVRAQGAAFATLFPPDTSKYPLITTLLDTFDDQGQYVLGLTPQQVTVLENGQQITPNTIQEQQPPISLVVAVNSGPTLAVRDGFGFSRYDKAAVVIANWATARPADSQDDLSLTWNGGILGSHLLPEEWKTRFAGFDPAPRTSAPGLAALSFALDVAQDTEPAPGGKKAILLVSGHLDNQNLDGLGDISARAKQAGVRIYVWLVDSKAFLDHAGALALQDLALSTGGRYLTFTGSETLPDPEEWLAPLRHIYTLTYTSKIRSAGSQTLSVQINAANGLALTSPTVSFQLNVQPPNPVLLSLPIQITRQNPDSPFDLESFLPAQQEVGILIEFPDGFQRAITRATLFVDGQKMGENTSAPFNKFTWDLSGYIASADHTVQVEVEDELGLSQKSASIPVQVTVIQPPGGMAGLILRNRTAVTLVFVGLALVVLLGILVLGGRSFSTFAERRRARARNLDPVTQPVQVAIETKKAPRATPFPWLRRKAPPPPAYFVKLTPDGQPAPGDPIPLTGSEMTFGTDPTQATHVLDHPSISALHARLRLTEEGAFLLSDQNSIAGTWVNYTATPKEGRVLKHGDMVNFGQLTYRFVVTKPPATPKPAITPHSTG